LKLKRLLASVAIAGSLLGSATACGFDYNGYAGPPYVVGTYTCVNPYSGQPDYCVEYSDGTSNMVPFWVYNTIGYGSVLSYSHSRYTIVHSTYYTGRRAPDVYHVSYHAHSYSSGYGGMSYRASNGQVRYRSYSPSSSYRSYSSFRSTSRSRF
jgi:hypothetical protein